MRSIHGHTEAFGQHSPTKQMRSDYYVSGRFYGTLYSLLLVRIHYVMSLNTKYVVRSQQMRSAPLPHYGVLAKCAGLLFTRNNKTSWTDPSVMFKFLCLVLQPS